MSFRPSRLASVIFGRCVPSAPAGHTWIACDLLFSSGLSRLRGLRGLHHVREGARRDPQPHPWPRGVLQERVLTPGAIRWGLALVRRAAAALRDRRGTRLASPAPPPAA